MADPFLRWAGSKQKMLPTLTQFWSKDYDRYIEPFVGSGQLFFNLEWDKAIISDLNVELIEVFKQIQKNPYPVYKIIENFTVSKHEYYKIRKIDPQSLGINQRVARFIYLNRFCFNGLYRTNNQGQFNVPFNNSKNKKICDYQNLLAVSKKLENVKILNGDFEKIVKQNVKRNDFIYLDPPYAVNNRKIFKQYGPQTFGIQDLERIHSLLDFINDRGAKFLLSYAFCKEANELFTNWTVYKTFTQRNISGFAEFRRKAAEILVTNIE